MGSFEERSANAVLNLGNLEFLAGQYQNRMSQVATLVEQRKTLTGKIQAAKAKKQDILQSAEAYEREFLDRSANLKLPTPGFATLQDGILAAFFITYFAVSILLIYNTIKTGSSGPVIAFAMIVLFGGGILSAELIRRFA